MGWFWAASDSAASAIAPHPISTPDARPPPACPMHKSTTAQAPFRAPSSPLPATSCPYAPPTGASAPAVANSSAPNERSSRPDSRSWVAKINPLNLMPSLPNAPTTSQNISLPLEREGSSIPRGPSTSSSSSGGCPIKHKSTSPAADCSAYADAASDRWQYPSPQQMYNALLRKGYTDTDPSAVPAMVAVHNFLNEGAWAEILEWERRFCAGLYPGWQISSRGEENSYFGAMTELEDDGWQKGMRSTQLRLARMSNPDSRARQETEETPEPRLLRFEGRPQDRTPKSRWNELLGRVWPAEYSSAPPFDRHDWYVLRYLPDGSTKEVRYVIDYYSGPTETSGEPVFYLDVRPAIDGPTALGERMLRWGGDAWWRASGGAAREKSELEKMIEKAREKRL